MTRVLDINQVFTEEYNQRADAMDAERKARLEARRKAGIAAREAAERQARLHAAVAKLKPTPVDTSSRKRGQRKDYAPINDYVRDRIKTYRLDGAPVAMIAHYLGVSKTSVRRVLREMQP